MIFLIKFIIYFFHKSALNIAVEKGNAKIVELLLSNKQIDVNFKCISNIIFE